VRVIHNIIHPSQSCVVGPLNSIEKTPKFFHSLHYRQTKNPAKAFVNPFIMEEAVAGTSAVTPEIDIDIDNIINVDDLIDIVDPISAAHNPQTSNTVEVPTSILCNPNRCPRDKSIKDIKNKEDAFDDGYDSDGERGPFYNKTDKEGPQLFNEEDDDDVGFVAERAIDDNVAEQSIDDTTDDVDEVHVPGGPPLKLTFSERVAEVRVSPKFFKILRILLKYYHIIMTMGMY
jgi:hypothetical protein